MTLQPELFNAILSMDAYNRGYNAGIEGLSDNTDGSIKIGTATLLDTKGDLAAQNIGFYALAYDTNNDGVADTIAYRGTDYPENPTERFLDPIHGWTLSVGDLSSEQGMMAVEFYKEVAGAGNHFISGITLTGHSLGGGLAGFVGELYDKDGYIYANDNDQKMKAVA